MKYKHPLILHNYEGYVNSCGQALTAEPPEGKIEVDLALVLYECQYILGIVAKLVEQLIEESAINHAVFLISAQKLIEQHFLTQESELNSIGKKTV